MDSQKTGALIAQRRKELGWTQRELGERLHVSDRAVSKWERAAGFPDVSLLEPLADALGLSVLELLNGERMRQEEIPPAETERAARSAVQQLGERLRRGIARYRAAVIVLSALLLLVTGYYLWWRFGDWSVTHMESREVSIGEAVKTVPFALITGDEYRLAWELREDPEIAAIARRMKEQGPAAYEALSAEEEAPYLELLHFGGDQPADPDTVEILISGYDASVDYWEGNQRILLEVVWDGSVVKYAMIYPEDPYKVEVLVNTDNESFALKYSRNGFSSFPFPFQP